MGIGVDGASGGASICAVQCCRQRVDDDASPLGDFIYVAEIASAADQ